MTDREDETHPPRSLGTRNLRALLGQSMLEERGVDLLQHVLARAEAGDPTALRLCLDRAVPRDRPVRFALPRMERVEDTPAAIAGITAALGAGTLSPRQAEE